MSRFWPAVAAILSVLYPLLWFWGRENGAFPYIAIMMAVIWAIRALVQRDRWQRLVSVILSIFFVAVLAGQAHGAMYWYPVLVSLLMLVLFGSSLFSPQSFVERLARLRHPRLPPEGVRHARRVTQVWCVFFLLNALLTTGLILAQAWRAWALYTGIIAYVLMGLLLLGEWLWRRRILSLK